MRPVEVLSLRDAAAEELAKRIYLCNLKEGDELKQQELAEQLGVSRIPLREALVQLEADGLVKTLQNKHKVVVGIDANRIRNRISLLESTEKFFAQQIKPISVFDFAGKSRRIPVLNVHDKLAQLLDDPVISKLHRTQRKLVSFFISEDLGIRKNLEKIDKEIESEMAMGNREGVEEKISEYYQKAQELILKKLKL
ncbi:MAG: GntR family transcriptional regulator [Burkholderiales bacterium]|nr:GntR family transcriptional regulator [Burkholderiales bacterium]